MARQHAQARFLRRSPAFARLIAVDCRRWPHVTTVTHTLRLQWERYFRKMRRCPAVRECSYMQGWVRSWT